MKIKKKRIPGQCDAMRCKEPVGEMQSLCGRHLQMSADLDQAEETPDHPIMKWVETGAPDPSADLIIAKALEALEIDSQEEYFSLVGVMHDTIDEREALDTLRKEAGRPFYEPWKAVNESFKPALDAKEQIVTQIKARVIEARLRQEFDQDDAINQGLPVPALWEDPPGLSIKPEVRILCQDLSQVPEDCLKVVLDTDAVMARIGAGEKEIAGLQIDRGYVVSYRRPNAPK